MVEKLNDFFLDISCKQQNYKLEPICGDTFMSRRSHNGERCMLVLSDGIGHGVKASVLSTLTASLAINNDYAYNDVSDLARNLLKTLPVCSKRKINYSTFTIVEVNQLNGKATIIEYDNPRCLIYRGNKSLKTISDSCVLQESDHKHQTIHTTTFSIREGDRIVMMTDGITNSGQSTGRYRFGWGHDNVDEFIKQKLSENIHLTSEELADFIVGQAVDNDSQIAIDDTSCAVLTVRSPKRVLMASCLPLNDETAKVLIDDLYSFSGKRMVCGYHLAKLISGINGHGIKKYYISEDADVPPMWEMQDIDIVSEGLVTLNKVYNILSKDNPYCIDKGPAFLIINTLLQCDEIYFLIGSKAQNEDDEYRYDEYQMRRNVLKQIASILENKYLKSVKLRYI